MKSGGALESYLLVVDPLNGTSDMLSKENFDPERDAALLEQVEQFAAYLRNRMSAPTLAPRKLTTSHAIKVVTASYLDFARKGEDKLANKAHVIARLFQTVLAPNGINPDALFPETAHEGIKGLGITMDDLADIGGHEQSAVAFRVVTITTSKHLSQMEPAQRRRVSQALKIVNAYWSEFGDDLCEIHSPQSATRTRMRGA